MWGNSSRNNDIRKTIVIYSHFKYNVAFKIINKLKFNNDRLKFNGDFKSHIMFMRTKGVNPISFFLFLTKVENRNRGTLVLGFGQQEPGTGSRLTRVPITGRFWFVSSPVTDFLSKLLFLTVYIKPVTSPGFGNSTKMSL